MATAGQLHLSRDRKVAPRGTYQASRRRWIASIPNSFGLPAGDTCPGRTPFCDACYAAATERGFQGVAAALRHNYDLLLEAHTQPAMAELLIEMLGRYHRQARRLDPADRIFRIHWSGDFYSTRYAAAWATAMREFPDVAFWTYTRSFLFGCDVVEHLAPVRNLTLYLSADAHNIDEARRAQATAAAGWCSHCSGYGDGHCEAENCDWVPSDNQPVRLAGCADDYVSARALVPDATICPENIGRLNLMDPRPEDPTIGRGACSTCGICITGRRDILFSESHVEDNSGPTPVVITGRPCKNPACTNKIPLASGRTRPREYCQRSCQLAVYYQKNRPRSHGTVDVQSAGMDAPGPASHRKVSTVESLGKIIEHLDANDGFIRSRDGRGLSKTLADLLGVTQGRVHAIIRTGEDAGQLTRSVNGKRTYWIAIAGREPRLERGEPGHVTVIKPAPAAPAAERVVVAPADAPLTLVPDRSIADLFDRLHAAIDERDPIRIRVAANAYAAKVEAELADAVDRIAALRDVIAQLRPQRATA